jgi:hypothetical protein
MLNILPQITFADYGELEILGDLERLLLAMLGLCDEALMHRLEARRGNGRNDYPVRVMWSLVIAMKVFGHNTVQSFRRELSRNSQLRKICGLCDFARKKHLVPPARVFSKFLALLIKEQLEIDSIFKRQVTELSEELPEFGENAAGDGKYLDSYAKRANKQSNPTAGLRAENDAQWSVKEYHYTDQNGNAKVKKEYHYGFKAHIICDVKTELPIAYNVLAANSDEKKAMMGLLDELTDPMKVRMRHLMLDRGYDSTEMIQKIKSVGIIPVIDIRNCWKDGESTRQYKDTGIVYDFQGNVFIIDDQLKQHRMHYEGYDKQKKCLRYSHKGKTHKIYISYDERVFLPVARDSKKFGRLYRGRTSVERLNGRLDRDYMLEDHRIRGLKKMKLMLSLTLLIMNAMALGKIRSGTTDHLAALTRIDIPKTA